MLTGAMQIAIRASWENQNAVERCFLWVHSILGRHLILRSSCASALAMTPTVLKDAGGDICLPSERRRTSRQSFPLPTQLPMGLGIKNRQKQTADICKQRLREKYPDKLGLVEEFIVEIEGPPKDCDVTRWGKFTDIRDIKKEMFQRLEVQFENWLNS
jgi:hypothetical protein